MTGSPQDLNDYRRALATLRLPRFAPRQAGDPFVVALEGPNGVGKTTLCRAMAERLEVRHCLGTDEAWFGETFKTRMIRDAEWYASAMFFLSGCFEQMRRLRQGREQLVIMDRCLWSTLAVHAAQNPHRLEALLAMIRPIAESIRIPRLTLVLEASFATCQGRIARKDKPARALDELTATEEFHGREQEFYAWLSGQASNIVFVEAEAKPEEVVRRAIAAFRKHRC